MRDHESDIRSISYFWDDKEDLERWTDFDREHLRREFPAVLKAWDDYKASRQVLDAVVRDLERQ